jgi:polyisoprenyl-phosphate glycosyltransferase
MKSLCVVVPCYNEEEVILEAYAEINDVLLGMKNLDTSIIFVNDGSVDATGRMLSELSNNDLRITVIHFSRNFGHQAAVTAGIHQSDEDFVVILDADLQDPPGLIPDMLDVMEREHANVVYCVRQARRGESLMKRYTSKLFYRLLNMLSEQSFPLDTGEFRIIDRRVADEFKRFREKGKYVRGIISWSGFKQIPYLYKRQPRRAGSTKYPLRKRIQFAGTAMLYFSKKPLKIATGLGFLAVLIGLIFAVWTVLGKIFGFTNPEIGWSSIILLVIFFGGVQLLTVGVLGQYIGIIFDEVKDRPEYIIDKID